MPTNPYITGLDLTKQAPRSPKTKVGGFYILGRTIDKCRALLFGTIGEYHFDCPLDNMLFEMRACDVKLNFRTQSPPSGRAVSACQTSWLESV